MTFGFRNVKGKIVEEAEFQKSVQSGEVARVAPNRKWFGEYQPGSISLA